MADKTPAADRSHGGPGSSHERADLPSHDKRRASGGHDNNPPAPGQPTSSDRSQASGGGGERDKHHTHDPKTKS